MRPVWLVVPACLWRHVAVSVSACGTSVLALASFDLLILVIDRSRIGPLHQSLSIYFIVHFLFLSRVVWIVLSGPPVLRVLVLGMRPRRLIDQLSAMLVYLKALYVCLRRLYCVFRGSCPVGPGSTRRGGVELCAAHPRRPWVDRCIQRQALLIMRSQHVAEKVVFGHLVLLERRVIHRLLMNLRRVGSVHRDISACSRWPTPVARVHLSGV